MVDRIIFSIFAPEFETQTYSYMENYKAALETLSGALEIANAQRMEAEKANALLLAEVQQLRAEKAYYQQQAEALLSALQREVELNAKELAPSIAGTRINPNYRKASAQNSRPATIVAFRPTANDN